jgi:riboflavin synthase
MFTGLVEEKGTLVARKANGPGAILEVRCSMGPLTLGESIAVDGACLTVVRRTATGFEADASSETLERTTLSILPHGASVNLERSVQAGARLGGHLVTGHVDATTTLASRTPLGDAVAMRFEADARLARFIAEKGSVAVNGVSLTVNTVADSPPASFAFDVVIIPHTLAVTSLGELRPGAKANLEVDLVARYVARILSAGDASSKAPPSPSTDAAWMDRLRAAGYV